MKIIDEKYPNLKIPHELFDFTDPCSVLFFDIETTGLNKASTSLYLIGCGYYKDSCLNTRFYFADSPHEESVILSKFFEFAQSYKSVIHFNGTKFDLPYLEYKASKYSISNPLFSLESIDIYKMIKPLRKVIFKESMRQKCVEDFLGVVRQDQYNGGELIEVYFEYLKSKRDEHFLLLMLHNREDVIGMHKIIPILNYLKLKDCNLKFQDYLINDYTDYNGDKKNEILITYQTNVILPKSFSAQDKEIYFKFESDTSKMIIRLPVINGSMKHFYENYKDYYYLTEEKRCIHKSIAFSLDKSLKQKAAKDNCYTIVNGNFLPQHELIFKDTCGPDYKRRNDYFLIPECFDEDTIEKYGKSMLSILFKK